MKFGDRFPLTKEKFTIGRDEDNDIVINEPRVSRKHAQIIRKGDNFILKDMDSSNGTFANLRAVKEYILNNGDVISLGGFGIANFQFEREDDKDEAVLVVLEKVLREGEESPVRKTVRVDKDKLYDEL